MVLSELAYPIPESVGRLTNNDILFGSPIPAIDRLKIFSPEDFENMTREWVTGFLMKKGLYLTCKKCSGAGDMGRDVIGMVDSKIWDNYQCKHYDDPLAPSNGVNAELGKLAYYTFKKAYTFPRKYYFVSPKGAGPKLNQLIEKPDELKQQLISNWDVHCKDKILKGEVPLTAELKKHLEAIDFSIFACYDPQQLIDEHHQTPYYATRFGGGLKKRSDPHPMPKEIQKKELVYTTQLFKAYSDFAKSVINEAAHLEGKEELLNHFNRQRLGFYSADSLNQFSRDTLPPDIDYFEDLKNEFYNGVIDTVQSEYKNGFERVKATTNFAKTISIDSNPLGSQLRMADREGICHHLVNETRLQWVRSV